MKAARASGEGATDGRVRATRRDDIVRAFKSRRVIFPLPASAGSGVEASLRATSRRPTDAECVVGRVRITGSEGSKCPRAALRAAALIFAVEKSSKL